MQCVAKGLNLFGYDSERYVWWGVPLFVFAVGALTISACGPGLEYQRNADPGDAVQQAAPGATPKPYLPAGATKHETMVREVRDESSIGWPSRSNHYTQRRLAMTHWTQNNADGELCVVARHVRMDDEFGRVLSQRWAFDGPRVDRPEELEKVRRLEIYDLNSCVLITQLTSQEEINAALARTVWRDGKPPEYDFDEIMSWLDSSEPPGGTAFWWSGYNWVSWRDLISSNRPPRAHDTTYRDASGSMQRISAGSYGTDRYWFHRELSAGLRFRTMRVDGAIDEDRTGREPPVSFWRPWKDLRYEATEHYDAEHLYAKGHDVFDSGWFYVLNNRPAQILGQPRPESYTEYDVRVAYDRRRWSQEPPEFKMTTCKEWRFDFNDQEAPDWYRTEWLEEPGGKPARWYLEGIPADMDEVEREILGQTLTLAEGCPGWNAARAISQKVIRTTNKYALASTQTNSPYVWDNEELGLVIGGTTTSEEGLSGGFDEDYRGGFRRFDLPEELAVDPCPAADESSPDAPVAGDVDQDGELTANDVDALSMAVRTGSTNPALDLDFDGDVDEGDRWYLIYDLLGSQVGDSNLDGISDSGDMVQVFVAGAYETGRAVGWAAGDWNGDGVFDASDMVLAGQGVTVATEDIFP